MADLPTKACWRAENARHVLATEALEGSQAVFLATHFPISDFEVEGTRSADVDTRDEQGLLDALSSFDVRHAFCVVEGEPGSGKSHLIRWLRVKWPVPDDEVVLIQRLDGSLEGTLRQLQEKLPGHEARFEGFAARAHDLTAAGQASEFYSNLVLSLGRGHLAKPPPDQEWCDKYDLHQLLHPAEIRARWTAPRRIVALLSGRKGDEQRDQDLARFNLGDVPELEQILRPLKAPSFRAVRFTRELQREVEGIRSLTDEDKTTPAQIEALRQRFPYSSGLVDALNLRRNSAVQNVLGISTEGLKEMFENLRRALAPRRLVLLLEDITAWEGVDNQLIDVLVTNVEARESDDLCPMASVVGLTPYYLQDRHFQANYRQRITHHVRLGHAESSDSLQEVSSLRTEDARVRFAASYLRAVRGGKERLEDWGGGPDPVPNVCETCQYRSACHAAFGHEGGVGLFPFNRRAISQLYESLSDPTSRSTLQTPRGMLQGVLGPTLNDPHALAAGEYPKSTVLSNWIPEEARRISAFTSDAIAVACEQEDDRGRLTRLIRFWGSGDAAAAKTTGGADGELRFGDVPRPVYEAFRLPWIGADRADEVPVWPPVPPTAPGDDGEDESEKPDDVDSGGRQAVRKKRPTRPGTTGRPVRSAELGQMRERLALWKSGEPRQAEKLNRLAADFVLDRLPWNRLGIPQWIRARLFTRDSIILEGTRQARATHFVLPREEWLGRGLEAFLDLRHAGSALDPNEQERHHRLFATALLELERHVKEHVRRRLPALDDGAQWPIATSATQVLVARAWLRGTVSPTGPPWRQWCTLLAEEAEAKSSPQERVDSWNETVERTRGSHGKHRNMLQALVNLPQADTDEFRFADGGVGAEAIDQLSRSLRLAPVPPEARSRDTQLAELEFLSRDARETDLRLAKLPERELERLRRCASAIDEWLRGLSVRDHLTRIDRVVESVSTELSNAAPVAVRDWQNRKRELVEQGFLDSDGDGPGREVEDLVDTILRPDAPIPDSPAERLDWLQRAPVRSVNVLYEALRVAEYAVTELHRFVSAYIAESPATGGSFESVQQAGQRVTAATDLALSGLKEGGDE